MSCSKLESKVTQISTTDYLHLQIYTGCQLDKLINFHNIGVFNRWEDFGLLPKTLDFALFYIVFRNHLKYHI